METKTKLAQRLGLSEKDTDGYALVVGWGASGESAAKLLRAAGMKVAVYDDGAQIPDWAENRSGMAYSAVTDDVSLAVFNPAVPLSHPLAAVLAARGAKIITELQLGDAVCDAAKITVSGTNGKTTTVSLIEHILKEDGVRAVALGNIGKPFSSEAAEIPEYGVAVLEVSSFMLEYGTVDADIAVLLNVTPDHLERHGSFAEYARIKAKLFDAQSPSEYAVFNADDAITRAISGKVKARPYFFSAENKCRGAFLRGTELMFSDDGTSEERVCGLDSVKLVGAHNVANCLAAVAVCKLYGVGNEAIKRGLESFNAPKYRLEYLGTYGGTAVFNDSKATNIDGTLQACAAMKGSTALIVGGYDKKLSYCGFFSRLPSGVKYIICCGDNSERIIECAPDNFSAEIFRTATLERAVMLGLSLHADNLLFSPSTSSYDRYRNFEERGRHFEQAVKTFCA